MKLKRSAFLLSLIGAAHAAVTKIGLSQINSTPAQIPSIIRVDVQVLTADLPAGGSLGLIPSVTTIAAAAKIVQVFQNGVLLRQGAGNDYLLNQDGTVTMQASAHAGDQFTLFIYS